jgi:hypothetical protein
VFAAEVLKIFIHALIWSEVNTDILLMVLKKSNYQLLKILVWILSFLGENHMKN